MNEIALANFYRVLNDADRFPQEHELAEAAIAAKDELNALRAPLPEARGAEEAATIDAEAAAYIEVAGNGVATGTNIPISSQSLGIVADAAAQDIAILHSECIEHNRTPLRQEVSAIIRKHMEKHYER